MFAPEINDAKNNLTDAYRSILSIDGFATTISNLMITKLPKDPDWLPPVRGELDTLRNDADAWTIARPDIWSPILLTFLNYIPTFTSFAGAARSGIAVDHSRSY